MFERFFDRMKVWIQNRGKVGPSTESREIFFNLPLPNELLDQKTNMPLTMYPRNKIRTTKYTPLNFLPLNIIFQFTNIANSYFLFIIILSAFQIFGVQNPGMQAVPLIVIVILTAIKDAFEDSRRAISDYELNSSKVHKLIGVENPNVVVDNVGYWRRFKKSCSKLTKAMLASLVARRKRKQNSPVDEIESSNDIDSFLSPEINNLSKTSTIRTSLSINRRRKSTNSHVHKKLSEFKENSVCDPNIQLSYGLNFKKSEWKSVNVGDLLKINKNEEIPSDVVILSASSEDNICYIETKNLDGETNLKPKKSLKCSQCIRTVADIERSAFSIGAEPPSKELYSFRGVIKYKGFSSENDTVGTDLSEPITIDNILLRGSVLRNTKYVLAIVIATGDDTKIIMNSGVTPTKKSKLSNDLNKFVIINFVLLFILCFVSGLVCGLFYRESSGGSRFYFDIKPYAPTPATNGVLSFFVNLIMYQTLVPISLYITIEIIKTFQAFFIYSDIEMYYEKLDHPCIPKSWGISDDLGQIEYVFSDKTGTLTQNVMEFRKCVIGNKIYGLSYTAAEEGADRRNGQVDVESKKLKMISMQKNSQEKMHTFLSDTNPYYKSENLHFVSSEFIDDFKTAFGNKVNGQGLENHDFMLALSLCHTAIIERDFIENSDIPGQNDAINFQYSAESPDEIALVSTARDMGIVFLGKDGDEYNIFDAVAKEILNFKVLCTIPFDSTRKRMSIVVRNSNGEIIMLTKGADNIILDRCIADDHSKPIGDALTEFSKEGLRTLCVAQRSVKETEFQDWYKKYMEASSLLDENREDKMNELSDSFEQGFQLIGATAIEDKLQDGVSDTIESIRKAGIKFWMLTGDKVETAISIGFSCSMLDNSMDLTILEKIEDFTALNEKLDEILENKFNLNGNDPKNIKWVKTDHSIPKDTNALVIDGKTLTTIFHESTPDEIRIKFLLLCKCCCSVLCCRVSPAQKAEVVLLVKNTIDVITLAIGDGANDVSMIQAANVGIGIAGEEGRQAAMSSDYAIGQFRYLRRLLLVHGRWSFMRLSEMIPCFFYKNVVFVMPLFWYGIFTNFDGTYLYEFSLLMLFNLFFTSLPVITVGCLDQDVPDYVSMEIPQLYRAGIMGKNHATLKFILYMIDGFYQSVLSFFWPWLIFYSGNFASHNGLAINDRFSFGNFSAVASIFSCNTYVLLRQRRWDTLSIGLFALSLALTVIWIPAYSSNLFSFNYYYTGVNVFRSAAFWAAVFLVLLLAMLPRFLYDVVSVTFFPGDVDIVKNLLNITMLEHREKDMEKDLEIARRIGSKEEDSFSDEIKAESDTF